MDTASKLLILSGVLNIAYGLILGIPAGIAIILIGVLQGLAQ